MANNKIVLGNEVLIDLSSDTVNASSMIDGTTAHDAAGNAITGTFDPSVYALKTQALGSIEGNIGHLYAKTISGTSKNILGFGDGFTAASMADGSLSVSITNAYDSGNGVNSVYVNSQTSVKYFIYLNIVIVNVGLLRITESSLSTGTVLVSGLPKPLEGVFYFPATTFGSSNSQSTRLGINASGNLILGTASYTTEMNYLSHIAYIYNGQ